MYRRLREEYLENHMLFLKKIEKKFPALENQMKKESSNVNGLNLEPVMEEPVNKENAVSEFMSESSQKEKDLDNEAQILKRLQSDETKNIDDVNKIKKSSNKIGIEERKSNKTVDKTKDQQVNVKKSNDNLDKKNISKNTSKKECVNEKEIKSKSSIKIKNNSKIEGNNSTLIDKNTNTKKAVRFSKKDLIKVENNDNNDNSNTQIKESKKTKDVKDNENKHADNDNDNEIGKEKTLYIETPSLKNFKNQEASNFKILNLWNDVVGRSQLFKSEELNEALNPEDYKVKKLHEEYQKSIKNERLNYLAFPKEKLREREKLKKEMLELMKRNIDIDTQEDDLRPWYQYGSIKLNNKRKLNILTNIYDKYNNNNYNQDNNNNFSVYKQNHNLRSLPNLKNNKLPTINTKLSSKMYWNSDENKEKNSNPQSRKNSININDNKVLGIEALKKQQNDKIYKTEFYLEQINPALAKQEENEKAKSLRSTVNNNFNLFNTNKKGNINLSPIKSGYNRLANDDYNKMLESFQQTLFPKSKVPNKNNVHCKHARHYLTSEEIELNRKESFKAKQVPDFLVRDNIDINNIIENWKSEMTANNPLATLTLDKNKKSQLETALASHSTKSKSIDTNNAKSVNKKDNYIKKEKTTDKKASELITNLTPTENDLNNQSYNKSVSPDSNILIDNMNKTVRFKGSNSERQSFRNTKASKMNSYNSNINKTNANFNGTNNNRSVSPENNMIKTNFLKTRNNYSKVIGVDNRQSLKFKEPVSINLHEKKMLEYIKSARFKQELYFKKLKEKNSSSGTNKNSSKNKYRGKKNELAEINKLDEISSINPDNLFRRTYTVDEESFYDKFETLKNSLIV